MKKSMMILLAVFILTASCGIGSAYTETRITTNTAEQTNPSIWSNYIVWQDTRNGGSDIYLQDLSTKVQTRVTSNVDAEYPCVSGDKIVWQDKRNGNWDIYMYEISSKKTTRITTNTSDQTVPGVYGNYIVWGDNRNGGYDIYLENLSTKEQTRITSGILAGNPTIYGNKIAWQTFEDQSLDKIMLYDISTKQTTEITYGMILDFSMYGNQIIFNDMYTGLVTTLYDFSAKKSIELPFMFVRDPAIYSNKIVFIDNPDGNSDIYMITLDSEVPNADFSASTTSGNAPLTVTFTDKSTESPNSWNWNFGDETSSAEKNPVHTYDKAGNYTVNLTVSNALGSTSKTLEIIVEEVKVIPTANFKTNVTSGYAPLTVQFTDLSENSTGRSWDFNNDWKGDSSEANPVYTFTSPGTYNVNLTAINENGTSTKTVTITAETKTISDESNGDTNSSDPSGSSPGSSDSDNSSDSGSSNNSSDSSDSSDSSSSSDSSGSSGESHSSGGSHHSSGSSGGGTGGSPEPQKNVEIKDTTKVFIPGDKPVYFNFTNDVTVVESISFTSEKTVGKTTAIVENLKDKSALVSSLPEGEVYKSFNVWVGNGGYGDSNNIQNAVINFKVEKPWIKENDINQSSIVLYKYDDKKKEWEKTTVTLSSEDDQFLYFTANVPGYSSFVITGDEGEKEEQSTVASEPAVRSTGSDVEDNASTIAAKATEEKEKSPGFSVVSGVVCLFCMFLYRVKRR
ncbi:PGF-pre-PGF domain-containing protein [Methanosarcina sp. DH2]|uniref:PGF-pre-PGF domain-containing protein n=1 Tax=Methanosarcina sp. DH2 TaxID=2605639 RepID=UPI001E55AD6E|nr:PGF-pre-PGF domain-containing protein [Methanosarcina sp. DH2]